MLEKRTLTPKQINNIYRFAKRIGKGLQLAETDPAYKREIIEALDVRVIFAVEDGQKVVYVQEQVTRPSDGQRYPAHCPLLQRPQLAKRLFPKYSFQLIDFIHLSSILA